MRLAGSLLFGLLVTLGSGMAAQETPQQPAVGATETINGLATASLTGTVVDADGDQVAGAQVALSGDRGGAIAKTTTDSDGRFSFADVAAGDVRLTVTANGFGPGLKAIALASGERLTVEPIALPVAADMNIDVNLSGEDRAEVEVKTEEKQRLGGVVPNFFVTYDWKAPSLTAKQKFELSWRSVIDPANIAINGVVAGVQQATNAFSGYHQGVEGFAKRWGANNADNVTGTLIGGAILPALFHQDPRYFYKGTGSVWVRGLYALSTAVICRGDNGRWQPNYSSIGGDLAAGAISNVYYPASNRSGAFLTVENGLLSAASMGVSNLLQELAFRHLTPHTHAVP